MAQSIQNEIMKDKQTNLRRPLRRKCLQCYPEAIRNKIQYFEAKSSLSDDQAHKAKSLGSVSMELQSVPADSSIGAACQRIPRVVGFTFKQNCDNYFDALKMTRSRSKSASSEIPTNQRFVVNLYESQCRADIMRPKSEIGGSILPVNSKLYIGGPVDLPGNKCAAKNEINSTYEMVQEAYKCCQIMKQTSQALKTCTAPSQFPNSVHEAEAERILLITELKYNKLLGRIREHRYRPGKKAGTSSTVNVALSNFHLPLTGRHSRKKTVWFLIVCTSKNDIQSSNLIEKTAKMQYLDFPESFTFQNLDTDFVINLKVYQLQSAEENRPKRSISLMNKKKSAPARRTIKLSFTDHENVEEIEVFSSLFSFCGSIDVSVDHMTDRKVLVFDKTSKDSLLFGVLKFTSSVDNVCLGKTKSGFITVGTEIKEAHIVWDRKWCRLEHYVLKFWPTPSEEDVNEPKLSLILNCCINVVVANYQRRPKTIVLEFCNVDILTNVTKYYLCMDTYVQYDEWKACLNDVIKSLTWWKKLQTKM